MRRPPQDPPSIAELTGVARPPAETQNPTMQAQLDRIEAKLDQILDMLRQR